MRRAAAAIISTLAGTALLVGVKSIGTPAATPAPALAGGPEEPALAADGGPSASTSVDPSASASAPVSASPSVSTTPTSAPPAAPTPGPATTAPPPPTGPPGGLSNGTYTGSTVTVTSRRGTVYEGLRVTITVSGGRITNASGNCINPTSDTSESICQDAVSTLRSEVLSAQSANIDTVSGATYTSNGYRTSLQAAIDAATA